MRRAIIELLHNLREVQATEKLVVEIGEGCCPVCALTFELSRHDNFRVPSIEMLTQIGNN